MNEPDGKSIAELLSDHERITAAINRSIRQAVLEHARAGRPVAAARDGKVVWVSPQEILARYGSEPAAQEKPAAGDELSES